MKVKVISILAVLLFLMNISIVPQFHALESSNEETEFWAVLIGITNYENDGISDLGGFAQSAQDLKDVLCNNGWREENILLLINETANCNAINSSLDWLYENVNSEDVVLFYFAGHGSTVKDEDGDEEDSEDEVICPYDCYSKGKKLVNFISDDELNEKFNLVESKNIKGMCLIFESCHSGELVSESNNKKSSKPKIIDKISKKSLFTSELKTDIDGENRVVITSAKYGSLGIHIEKTRYDENGKEICKYYFTFGQGISEAINNGKTTAEKIFEYSKQRYLSDPSVWMVMIFQSLLSIFSGYLTLPIPTIYDYYEGELQIIN